MPIMTGNHPKALWPGVKAWWGVQYNKHQEQFPDLFDMESSSQNYEEDVQTHGFGLAPVKPEGEPLRVASNSQGFVSRYTHVAYALGYIVTKEELDDNKYPKVSRSRAGSLAFSMRQTKENVAANIYNRASNDSYPGGDGVGLASLAHPLKRGGTFANELTAATFSESALEDMLVAIAGAVNDDGLQISLQGDKLIVPRQLMFDAERILESNLQNDTANNAINALKSKGMLPGGVAVNQYLTSSTAYFVRTNCPEGLKCYNRVAAQFDKDNDFHTKNALASCYERYSFGWTDPRAVWQSSTSLLFLVNSGVGKSSEMLTK